VAYATPLYHGVALCRDLTLGTVHLWVDLGHAAYLAPGCHRLPRSAGAPSPSGWSYERPSRPTAERPTPAWPCASPRWPLLGGRHAARVLERNILVYRRSWIFIVSGFFEPLFYLLSIGVGLSHLVGPIPVGRASVAYTAFVAPGLLASSAMNGAMIDSTFHGSSS
jgi:hypothetical protein